MSNTSPAAVLSTRVSSETRARFAALAAQHRLSESSLLRKLVEVVLTDNKFESGRRPASPSIVERSGGNAAADRITVRLRQGDLARVALRADARHVRASTYLALLVHNHVNAVAVLPPTEIDRLKATTAHLAALGRELRMFVVPNKSVDPAAFELSDLVERIRQEIETVRAASAAVVRRNHESWKAGHA